MPSNLSITTDEVATGLRGDLELVIVTSEGVRERRLPPSGELLVGRDPSMSLCIPDGSVSRHHLTLSIGESGVVAIDQGSRNGTNVGGVRLPSGGRVLLTSGVAVQIGGATLVVRAAHRESLGPVSTAAIVVDPEMKRVYELVDTVAPSPISLLVLGETGVGKEVVAAAIHARSPRSARPMMRLNCAAIPATVIESELFGYEKGAFTGAVQAKPGLLEMAHESTLFLDEIGDAPLDVQAKLLRFLETGEVLRVGSVRPRIFDVRVVAATNRDLEAMIAAGQFRADLFYRLNGLVLRVPPLRERPSEILPLAEGFVVSGGRRVGRTSGIGFSNAARAALLAHPWPGNVRELRAVVERAVVLARGTAIEPTDLVLGTASPIPASSRDPAPAPPPASTDAPTPADLAAIQTALAETAGNQSRAAKLLGISRKTLLKRLERFEVPRPRKGR